METNIKIKTKDDFIIHGILNSQDKTDRTIILVGGLGGVKELHTRYNSKYFFPKHGFDTFNFDFYSNEEKGRKLSECSISTFVFDLNQIYEYFEKKYNEIYVIGHSLGACVVINSNQENIKKIVLWDGTLFPKDEESEKFNKNRFIYIKELDKYLLNSSVEYIVSKELVKERNEQDEKIIPLIKRPIKLIMAGNFFLKDKWKENLNLISVPYEFKIIEGANHGFDEEGKERELFEETLNWLKDK